MRMMGKHGVYKYEVGEVVNETLKIVKQIRIKRKTSDRVDRGYVVKSLNYPADKNDYEITEGGLKRGSGCVYLHGHRVCEETSLYSIKHLRPYIIDIEKAKNTAKKSHQKMLFRCICGETKGMTVNKLTERGLTCRNCSKGLPHPEIMMLAYLQIKNIKYDYQVTYKELGLRSYDFRIKLNGVVFLLETHGEQHYYTKDRTYWKVEKIQESDNIKRNYAYDNNINYIELDCRESSFEFIRRQIENNEHLPSIKDSEIDNMLEVMELNSKYPIKEIIELYETNKLATHKIADKYNISRDAIVGVLKRNNITLRSSGETQATEVRCVETGEVFKSMNDAERRTGVSCTSIGMNIKGKRKSAGKDPVTGKPLHWERID